MINLLIRMKLKLMILIKLHKNYLLHYLLNLENLLKKKKRLRKMIIKVSINNVVIKIF